MDTLLTKNVIHWIHANADTNGSSERRIKWWFGQTFCGMGQTHITKIRRTNLPIYIIRDAINSVFKLFYYNNIRGPRGSVVGWGTMLQAGRSPVRVPDEVYFFNLPNSSSRTMALGSTQPLTEMSTMNLPGGKKRPACRADNLAAIYEPNVWKCGSLNLSQP
jgi:hypothetical protein